VREEMEHRPELRRLALQREIRFASISAIYFGCFSYFMNNHRSVTVSIIIGIAYGACMMFIAWWQRLRPRRTQG
jgi:hypothetical protein